MANKIQIRRDTAANWTSANPTLSQGEQGYETDTGKLKIGDGSTAWTSLGYSFEDTTVGGDTGVDFNDNVKARFGTGNDLEIYHNGTSSIIENTSAGQYLRIRSAGGMQFTTSGTENALIGIQDSKVGLYYDGSEKLETTSSGIQTTGTVNVNGAYTLPTSDGTNGQVLTTDGSGAVTFADAGGGSSLELFVENPSSPTTPLAGGTNGVAIGSGSNAGGSGAVAIGVGSAAGDGAFCAINGGGNTAYGAVGNRSIAMGEAARAQGQDSVAIGENSLASSADSFAIGYNTDATATNASAFGYNAQAAGSRAIALGNSRAGGTDSFAAAIANNTSSYGATGANSIAIGYQSKATNADAVAIGDRNVASGASSIALGRSVASGSNSVAIGLLSDATAQGAIALGNGYTFNGAQATFYNSIAIGQGSLSDKIGKVAVSGAAFSSSGDGQHGIFVLRVATTDATATPLITGPDYLNSYTADGENQVILPNNSAYFFSGTCVARESATDGTDMGAWEFKGCIRREANAGTTTLVSSTIDEFSAPTGWSIALSADTTNGGLAVTVTGAASTNIRWVATVHTSEVTYA